MKISLGLVVVIFMLVGFYFFQFNDNKESVASKPAREKTADGKIIHDDILMKKEAPSSKTSKIISYEKVEQETVSFYEKELPGSFYEDVAHADNSFEKLDELEQQYIAESNELDELNQLDDMYQEK